MKRYIRQCLVPSLVAALCLTLGVGLGGRAPSRAVEVGNRNSMSAYPTNRVVSQAQAAAMLRADTAKLLRDVGYTTVPEMKVTLDDPHFDPGDRPTNPFTVVTAILDVRRLPGRNVAALTQPELLHRATSQGWRLGSGWTPYDETLTNGNIMCYALYDDSSTQQVTTLTCESGVFVPLNGVLRPVPRGKRNTKLFATTRNGAQQRAWSSLAVVQIRRLVEEFIHLLHAQEIDGFYYFTPSFHVVVGMKRPDPTVWKNTTTRLEKQGWTLETVAYNRDWSKIQATKGSTVCLFTDYATVNMFNRQPIECSAQTPGSVVPLLFLVSSPAKAGVYRLEDKGFFPQLTALTSRGVVVQGGDFSGVTLVSQHGWWLQSDYDPQTALVVDRRWGLEDLKNNRELFEER